MNDRDKGPLLQLIPRDRLSSRQKALLPKKFTKDLPVYKMLREPTALGEFDWKKLGKIAIWWQNRTVIFVCGEPFEPLWPRNVSFALLNVGRDLCTLYGAVYGKSDTAIAETATFFWSLKHWVDVRCALRLGVCIKNGKPNSILDFAAFQAEQLACILDSNPPRHFAIPTSLLTAKQSVVLATRPYHLQLELQGNGFAFKDEGTAFVDALQNRQLSFGLLYLICREYGTPFSPNNLSRLVELEIFDYLSVLWPSKECALAPFSAKARKLEYWVDADHFQIEDFEYLNMRTKDLTLQLFLDSSVEWDRVLIAFLERVAQLGHFEHLCLSVHNRLEQFQLLDDPYEFEEPFDFDKVAPVAEALVRAIADNPKLRKLDLSKSDCKFLNWEPHLPAISRAMEEHESLREFVVQAEDESDDESDDDEVESMVKSDYSWLERLLSRNRNIFVINKADNIISAGYKVHKLFVLNHFYNDSASLVKETAPLRSSLVATALVGKAFANFHFTRLLLSHHTDVLRDMMQNILEDSA